MRTNFRMENQNITMTRGDTLSFNVEVIGTDGNTMAVDSAFLTCKKLATDETYVFQKSLGSGITQFLSSNYMVVRVAPNDTKEVEAGQYFYDMQIGIGDDIFTILRGILAIEQDVTF